MISAYDNFKNTDPYMLDSLYFRAEGRRKLGGKSSLWNGMIFICK